MAINYHIYAQREMRLAAAMGKALDRWALLEATLLRATVVCAGQDQMLTAKLMGLFKTFSLSLDYTDTCVRYRLGDVKLTPHWNSLVEYARELSGDRNYIAHSGIVRHADGDTARPDMDWNDAEPMIGPSTQEVFKGDGDIRAMNFAEVQHLILDFEHCYKAINNFTNSFLAFGPLPEIYWMPIVRRRHSRKERLEAKRQERQRQRQPSQG